MIPLLKILSMPTFWLQVKSNTLLVSYRLDFLIGMILMGFVTTFAAAHGWLLGLKVGMICRIMCTSAIYQKVRVYVTSWYIV